MSRLVPSKWHAFKKCRRPPTTSHKNKHHHPSTPPPPPPPPLPSSLCLKIKYPPLGLVYIAELICNASILHAEEMHLIIWKTAMAWGFGSLLSPGGTVAFSLMACITLWPFPEACNYVLNLTLCPPSSFFVCLWQDMGINPAYWWSASPASRWYINTLQQCFDARAWTKDEIKMIVASTKSFMEWMWSICSSMLDVCGLQ